MLYGTANARIRQGKETSAARRAANFLLGDVWINPDINQIGDERVEPKAMNVLLAMAAVAPKVVSTADMLELVWPGTVVVDNVVHRAITHLRKVLGDNARMPRFIESIPRRGYRVVAPVQLPASTVAAAADEVASTTERELREIEVVVGRMRLLLGTGVDGADINRLSLELARRALALCSGEATEPS